MLILFSFSYYYIEIENKNKPNSLHIVETSNISKYINVISKVQKLHTFSKNPFITIIVDYSNNKLEFEKISHLIKILLDQSYKDIQIVLLFSSDYKINQEKLTNYGIMNKTIQVYSLRYKQWIHNIIDIINQIRGRYIILLDKYVELRNNELSTIFNLTKGNINHILKYILNDKSYLYIIRTKTLRDIFDFVDEFNNIQEIIDYLLSYPPPKLNYIPISYSPDNMYSTLCYTSMLSVLDSKSISSFVLFFILIPNDFTENNIRFLESLYEQYDYFNISFIKMDDRWKKAFSSNYLTIQTYYRYSLGELIKYLDKIIYLDADTICLKDLLDFYHLNFKGKLLLGRLLKTNIIDNKEYYSINCGILLLNLKEMRKMKIEEQILNILNNGFGHNKIQGKIINEFTDVKMADQAIINGYFYKYIGLFPPKYNGKRYFNYNITVQYNNNSGNLYDNNYLYFSFKYPSIKHYPGPKPNLFYTEEWEYFARKSKYFQKISKNISNIYNYSLENL